MNRKLTLACRGLLGILALLILVRLVTAIALNHADDLDLDQRYIGGDWLMSHYGIGDMEPDAAFLVDNKVISQFGPRLFIDARPVTHLQRPLLGAIALDTVIVLATDNALILLNHDGEYIEHLAAESGVPAPIQNIGVYHGEPVIQARSGMWRSNFMLDIWEPMSLQGVSWSEPYPMPDSVAADLKQFFHGKGVSVDQFLSDVYTGRILGNVGVWLMDFLIIVLLTVAFSGLWWWGKRLK